jgi:hypothetical protein
MNETKDIIEELNKSEFGHNLFKCSTLEKLGEFLTKKLSSDFNTPIQWRILKMEYADSFSGSPSSGAYYCHSNLKGISVDIFLPLTGIGGHVSLIDMGGEYTPDIIFSESNEDFIMKSIQDAIKKSLISEGTQ